MYISENNTQDFPMFFLFVSLSVCEIYACVTKHSTQDVFVGVYLY